MPNTYPRSSITLYKTKIKPSANVYIDDLSTYLSNIIAADKEVLECQYIKHELDITLKLNMSEDKQTNFKYNYVSITNKKSASEIETTMYYFIMNSKPVAQNTIELVLKMDSVNSLGQAALSPANPKNFTKKTFIEREHQDRFVKPTSYTPSARALFNKIDKEPENLDTKKVKTKDTKLELNNDANQDWYLVFDGEATDPSHPMKVQVIPQNRISCTSSAAGGTLSLNPEWFGLDSTQYFGTKKIYFLKDYNSDGFTVQLTNPTAYTPQPCDYTGAITSYSQGDTVQEGYLTINGVVYWNICTAANFGFYKENNQIVMVIQPLNTSMPQATTSAHFGYKPYKVKCDSIVISKSLSYMLIDYTAEGRAAGISDLASDWENANQYGTFTSAITGTHDQITLLGIDDINRTDQSLQKIIKLPYCPIDYTISNHVFTFDENIWDPTTGKLTYKLIYVPDLTIEPLMTVNSSSIFVSTLTATPTVQDAINIEFETKLKNTQFSTYKFVYDNFIYQIKPEMVEIPSNATRWDCPIKVDYKVSSALTSKFLFKFDFSDFANVYTTEDFENYLVVNRNNEEIIFTNNYLNYINVGYNYDKKSMAIRNESEWRQQTYNALNIVPGALGGAVMGNYAAAGFSMVSKGISMAASLDQLQTTQDLRKLAFDKNIDELKAQGSKVVGTDDLQLMEYYNGNRLKWITYRTADLEREEVARIFYYFGYNRRKHEVPLTNTRIWFNYLKCLPVLTNENIDNVKPEWLDDLKEKYNTGVTILHHNTINSATVWDFDQQYENWETWIVNGVN